MHPSSLVLWQSYLASSSLSVSSSVSLFLHHSVGSAVPLLVPFLCPFSPHVPAIAVSILAGAHRYSPSASYRREDVVVRASASQSVDLGFIFQIKSYHKTSKNGIRGFPAWRSVLRDSVENKPASLLVASLGKALNGMPPSSCGKQAMGPSSLPVVVAQSVERHTN